MDKVAQLVKLAKDELKPYEAAGTVGSAITSGAKGGAVVLGGVTAGRMIKHKLTAKGKPDNVVYLQNRKTADKVYGTAGRAKTLSFDAARKSNLVGKAKSIAGRIGKAGLKGAAIGGSLGLGLGVVRGMARGLTGKTSIHPDELKYRAAQGE